MILCKCFYVNCHFGRDILFSPCLKNQCALKWELLFNFLKKFSALFSNDNSKAVGMNLSLGIIVFHNFIVKFYTSTWNLNLLFQVLALSATYPDELASLVEKFMRSPQHVRIAQTNQVLCGVMQFVQLLEFSPSQIKQNQIKQEALLKILSCIPYNQCLVFSNYQVKKSIYVFYKNEDNYLLMCSLISWQEDSAGWSKTRWMQKCTGEIWHISNGHTIFKRPDKLPFITC